ncbi:aminotransferase class V-fold PLP-dependent enzyme [bacterium]|nr:aminotransferase class V-fold PLP-dependent enzyme [bacterium]
MPIYLDNAATSHPKPEAVYRAVDHALREIGASPGRGGYRRGLDATRIVFGARESLAELFGIKDSARLAFTSSATEALNLAIAGILGPGDHAVTTTMEHNSVSRPLRMAEKRGASITRIPCDQSGFLNPRDLANALHADTRLIVLSHCSNVTGTIQPIAEVGHLASQAGVPLLVDAAQSAGIIPVDVEAMGISLLAAPGHKGLLGPQGTGFLYLAEGLELPPLVVGGTGGHSSGEEQPEEMPARFESGTLNTPGIAGLQAGVEFILGTGIEVIRKKEISHVRHLLAGLAEIQGITLYGPAPEKERGGIVSFTVEGKDPAMIGFALDHEFAVEVRTGLHCAPAAHRTIGTYPAGTIRVSPGWFTTEDEIETFLRAMHRIVTT